MGDSTNPGSFFEAGARIAVLSGATNRQQFLIYPESPSQAFRVGAGPDCNWQVFAHGVASAHFELSWDGQDLFVDPAPGSPGVSINGATHRHRHRIAGEARVQFGDACLLVQVGAEAEAPGEPTSARSSGLHTPFHVARPPKLVPDRSMVRTAFGIASADLAAMVAKADSLASADSAALLATTDSLTRADRAAILKVDGLALSEPARMEPARTPTPVRALRMLAVSTPDPGVAWHASATGFAHQASVAGLAHQASAAVSTPVSNLATPVLAVSTPLPRLATVPEPMASLARQGQAARELERGGDAKDLGTTMIRERYVGPDSRNIARPSGSPRSPLFITPSAPRDEFMRALSAGHQPAPVARPRKLSPMVLALLGITSLPLFLPAVRQEMRALAAQVWRVLLMLFH